MTRLYKWPVIIAGTLGLLSLFYLQENIKWDPGFLPETSLVFQTTSHRSSTAHGKQVSTTPTELHDNVKAKNSTESSRGAGEVSESDTLQGYNIEDHIEYDRPEKYFGTKYWRKYYPEVARYLAGIEGGSYEWPVPVKNATSAIYTELQWVEPNSTQYKVGDILKAVIRARDGFGKPKVHGGDYFHVRFVRFDSDSNKPSDDAMSTEAIDNYDGTYTLEVPLLWPGKVSILAELVHSSEAVAKLISLTTGFVGRGVTFGGTFQNGEKRECNVGLKIRNSTQIPCNFSQPEKGVSWYCYPPTTGGCSELKWIVVRWDQAASLAFGKQPFFEVGLNWKASIKGSGSTISVQPSGYRVFENLPPCTPRTGLAPAAFDSHLGPHTGLYSSRRWRSLQCSNSDARDLARAPNCLRNKVLYLIGDSTLRQWYLVLLSNLKMQELEKEDRVVWQKPRSAEKRSINLTVIYRGHGSPLHGLGPPSSRPYIADTLAAIDHGNGEHVYIVINLALHFYLVDTVVYMKRIEAVKKSVVRLMKRMPKVVVFLRGCIRHKNSKTPVPSEWFSYRLCKILKGMFGDLPSVGIVDTWPMTSAHLTLDAHPENSHVADHIAMFLSYVCPASN